MGHRDLLRLSSTNARDWACGSGDAAVRSSRSSLELSESNRHQLAALNAVGTLLQEGETLSLGQTQWHHKPPTRFELLDQRPGYVLCSRRDQNLVEGRVLGPAAGAIANSEFNVPDPNQLQASLRRTDEL